MALSPRMEFRQQQTLAMTPQMQQSIRLLQMSSAELSVYVADEVEKNPLLEFPAPAQAVSPALPKTGAVHTGDNWDRVAEGTTLWTHLQNQIRTMRLDQLVMEAALVLADELNDDGYLRVPLEDVAARHRLPLKVLGRALRVVQSCEPTGVGARTLAECLMLQQRERDRCDPAMMTLLSNLGLLELGRLDELAALCGTDEEEFADMLAELRSLDPKPGLAFANDTVGIAVPDIFVRAAESGLRVELNTMTLPRVQIDNAYSTELMSGRQPQAFISECRTSANWLIRALEQRARTILKVASEIVIEQEAFFSQGPLALRPMTQRAIARRCTLHESTVSRVIAGKILACDQGSFELAYFFNSGISSLNGDPEHSARAVQCRIRALVAKEAPPNTLSDDQLVRLLRKEGIDIARRTVAKYRDVLGIPSSVQRRRRGSSYLSRI